LVLQDLIARRNKPKKEVKTARVPMIPEADFPMLSEENIK
jgi:hypothetical protein